MSYRSLVLGHEALLAYWRLGDEGAGAIDQVGLGPSDADGANPGTLQGGVVLGGAAALLNSDPTAKATQFTAANSNRIYVPTLTAAASGWGTAGTAISLECWLQRDSSVGNYAPFGALSARPLVAFEGATARFYTQTGGPQWSVAVTHDTSLHHWVFTYDDATLNGKVYKDGVLLQSSAASAGYSGAPGHMILGAWSSASYPLDGKMQDAAVYSAVLTAAVVKSHYEAGIIAEETAFASARPGVAVQA